MIPEAARYLFLAGAFPYLVLGVAHALVTPLRQGDRRGLSPADPSLVQAMAATPPRLVRRMDMWHAWIGFNLSHSLGLLLFGAVAIAAARTPAAFAAEAAVFQPLAIVVSALYLGLACLYWFRVPITGCLIAFLCFSSSTVLTVLGSR